MDREAEIAALEKRVMGASRFLRRSGIAVALLAYHLNWRADIIVQVGVGAYHKEVDVFKQEWPGVRFIGFEPHPDIAEGLRHGSDPYPGAIHQFAVTDSVGTASLFIRNRHGDGSSLLDVERASRKVTVSTTTLDSFLFAGLQNFAASVTPRVLLWLDCEGTEGKVIDGAARFLDHVDVVNVEMTQKPTAANWITPMEVHKRMVKAGFWALWLHTQRISAGQNDWVYVRPHLFKPEYCCFPWEIERWQTSLNQ